jgi:hypothetical protein
MFLVVTRNRDFVTISIKTQTNTLDITKLYGFTPVHFNIGNGGSWNVINNGFITGSGAMSAILSNGKKYHPR